jgi:hypothetical protein
MQMGGMGAGKQFVDRARVVKRALRFESAVSRRDMIDKAGLLEEEGHARDED